MEGQNHNFIFLLEISDKNDNGRSIKVDKKALLAPELTEPQQTILRSRTLLQRIFKEVQMSFKSIQQTETN